MGILDLVLKKEEETDILEYGNINLNNRPVIKNPDGSISTLLSKSFNFDGVEVLLPTIINGRKVSDQEAIDYYRKTGEFLGKFKTPKAATDYAKQLSKLQGEKEEKKEKEPAGWSQRMGGIGEIPSSLLNSVLKEEEADKKEKSGGGGSAGAIEEEPEENPLDVLNESIEKNYKDYLKLQKNLTEFDTTLEGIPETIKPTIIANYNKEVNRFNSLISTLQTDISKRDEIYSVQKKQEFIRRKHLEEQEVEIQKMRRPPMLDLDRANKYVAAPIKGIIHGIYSTPQAVGGLMRLVGENMQAVEGTPNVFKGDEGKYTDLMKAISKTKDSALYKPIDKFLVDKSQEIIKANREFLSKKELHPDLDNKTAAWLFQLGSGATSLAGAVGISVLTGSPHAAAVAFGMYQTGSMYQEAREADVKVSKAMPLAVTAGVIEGALEYIGLEWLFTKFGGNFWVDRLLHAGLEGFQEFSQQIGENLVATIGWDKTRSIWEGTAESTSIGAVLGGGASAITTNVEQTIDLTELSPEQKKGLIGNIVEKQLKTIAKILPNLNPITIMEKVKTDPDIQKAILGIFERESEMETYAYKTEEEMKTKPKEPTKEEIYAKKYGIPLEKVKVTELPKADVTSEFVSEKTIRKLEELVGKEITPKEVLKKVEEKIAPKEELKVEGKEPTISKELEPLIFQEFKDNVRDSFGIVIGENPDSKITLYSPTPTPEIIVGTKGKSEVQKIGEALHEIGHLTTMDEGTYFPELMGRDKFLATELDAYKWAIDNSSKFGINPEIVMDIMPESFKNKYSEEIEQYLQIKVKKAVEEPPKPPIPPKGTAEMAEPEEEPEFPKDVKIKDIYTEGEELTPKQVKAKVREVTGQTKGEKIELYESDMLKYVLKGEERTAREVFKAGKKEGIFATKEKFEEKIEKIKEHQKEVKAKAKEREAQKKYIKKLINDINKLPTQNIAVDYRDKIEAIKETFDLKKRQQKTLHAREETAKFIEREIKEGNTNLRIPQEVIDIIKKIPLNDMTIAQLEDVHDTILQLAHIGKTKGKLLKIQKGRRTEELVQDLIKTLYKGKEIPIGRNIKQEMRELESSKKKIKDIWSHFWMNTTLDESLFERMDGEKRGLWCETFYDAVNKCTNDELLSTFKKIEDYQESITDDKINIVKFLQERTGDLMLTPSQRTGVYLCSLDEDAKRHIQGAGVYLMKGMKEPYKFTDKDIENVVNSLTKEEKAMAEYYQKYQLTQGDQLDEFDVRVRGVHLKKVKNRFGIQIINEELDNSVAIDMERNPTTRRAYLEQGFREPRTHRAENIINIDCVSNLLRDMAKVEHYKAYEETVIDINNLLTNEELKNAIIQNPRYGRIAYDNIVKWFKDSVKAKQSKILSTSDKALMFLRTSAFFSMLGINIISGSKQLVSLCNAVAETDLATILSGIEQVALHYNETKQFAFQKDPQMRARKGQIDKIMREWMETTDAKQILTGKTKDIRMKTLFLIRALDEFAVLSVWIGTYNSVMNTHKIQGKPIQFTDLADLDRQAIKRTGEVMRKTQPAALTKDLPQWFRDGTVANLFNLFQNQINKNQNYIRHDMFGKLKAGQISPGTFAHRVLWGWFLPAVLIGTITRGRPPKDWKELVKDMGVYYIGGWFFVGSIVVNIMEGYGGYMPAPLSFGEEFIKAATYKTWESKFQHGISGICKVIGLPYNQPYRTIDGVDDWLQGETDDIRRLIWTKYVLEQGKEKEAEPAKFKKPEILKKTLGVKKPTILKNKVSKPKVLTK